jgi:hypothetical protein
MVVSCEGLYLGLPKRRQRSAGAERVDFSNCATLNHPGEIVWQHVRAEDAGAEGGVMSALRPSLASENARLTELPSREA